MVPSLLLLAVSFAGFANLDEADRQVASFVAASSPSASPQPPDRRLRLAPCPAPLTIGWFGAEHRSVLVQCPASGTNWRVYVPVAGAGPATSPTVDPASSRSFAAATK